MKQLLHRLTSLLLVLTMVMSLALTATAADLSTDDSAPESSVTEQETDFDIDAQLITSDGDQDENKDEGEDDGDPDPADAPEEESEPQDDADQGDESPDASEEKSRDSADDSAGEAPAQTDDVSEAEGVDSEEGAEVDELSAVSYGWSKTDEGYVFYYLPEDAEENSAPVQAKNGWFALPEQKEITLNGAKYTFSAGVYQFDDKGLLAKQENTAKTAGDKTVTIIEASEDKKNQFEAVETGVKRRVETAKGNSPKEAQDTKTKVTTVSSLSVLFTGKYNDKFYLEGELYTGFMRTKEGAPLYAVTDGVAAKHNGRMKADGEFDSYIVNYERVDEFDMLWYYNGKPYTGFFRADDATNPKALYVVKDGKAKLCNAQMKQQGVYKTYIKNYKSVNTFDKLWYVNGLPYTGFFLGANGKVYIIKEGKESLFTGTMEKQTFGGTTYKKYVENYKDTKLTGLYYEKGLKLTGVPSVMTMSNGKKPALYVYKAGKKQNVKNGWYKAPRAADEFYKPFVYYYIKGNKAVTGNHRLKAIGNRGTKYKDSSIYRFTFRDNGTLVTNLFNYQPSLKNSGKFKIYADHTNYTCTILAYNSSTKKYDIPCKSFVVAMSTSMSATADNGTKYGDYPLASGKPSWYRYLSKKGTWCWYSSSVHIWGSGSMFHSANYYDFKKSTGEAKRHHMMIAHIYNQIGTNVTAHCVRAQTINIKLITALYKASSKFTNHGRKCSKNIRVYLTRANKNKNLPFGQMTLLNNNDLNGYVIQRANIGYGKDHVADPTDTYCKGETIYMAKSKVTSKSKCTKIKMLSSSNYSCTYGPA